MPNSTQAVNAYLLRSPAPKIPQSLSSPVQHRDDQPSRDLQVALLLSTPLLGSHVLVANGGSLAAPIDKLLSSPSKSRNSMAYQHLQ